MEKKIEEAIRSTLVIGNSQSMHIAIKKIIEIIWKETSVSSPSGDKS